MTSFIGYFVSNIPVILQYTMQHLRIGTLAVTAAILVGVPLGLIISKSKWFSRPVLNLASIMQAIPSLALMGVFIPIIGIGDKTAIVIIALYALLPIIRNTFTGITTISEETIDAARGIGMTEKQILFRVQLPLALPVIMAGIRTAAVNSVGMATIAAFIGGGGLGKQIYAGIQIINTTMILSGALPACLLALLVDFVFSLIEKAVVPISLRLTSENIDFDKIQKMKMSQKRTLRIVSCCLLFLVGSVIYDSIEITKTETITIGTTEYIEERIVSQLYKQIIESHTDIKVKLNNAMGGTLVVWEALKNAEIDMVPGYTGTYYATVLGLKLYPGMTRQDTYNNVQEALKEHNIRATGQLGPNNQYVFAVKPELAEQYHIQKVSDLTRYAKNWTVGCSQGFYARENDGLFPVCNEYGMSFKNALTFGAAPMYLALENGDVDVIVTYRTDGLLQKYDLTLLEDDHNFFPPYVLFSMISEQTLNKYPELLDAVLLLENAVTDEEMQNMNYRGAQNGEDPAVIAEDFLVSHGFITRRVMN